jgi:hypothetical protein
MSSKFSKEGYLSIDHRDSPGLPDEAVHRAGLPPGAGRGVFECPTYTCTHCCTVVILNPVRRRDRAYCAKCDRYICDACGAAMAASGVCKPFAQIVEEVQEAACKNIITPAGV